MVDWAYVSGMADDSGMDLDHEQFDPDGHCGPSLPCLFSQLGARKNRSAYGPPVACNRCGEKQVFWQKVKGAYVLYEKALLIPHICQTTTEGFEDEPIF